VIKQTNRAFGLMFFVVFCVIGIVGYLFFHTVWIWSLSMALVCLVAAYAAPWLLMPFNRLWANFAGILGQVNNSIVMGVFFFIVMTPLGWLIQALGRDPLQRRKNPGATTYLVPVKRQANKETYGDLF